MPTPFERFTAQLRIVRFAVTASPFLGLTLGHVSFLWPPLGSLQVFAAGLATVIIYFLGLVPFQIPTKKAAGRWLVVAVAIAMCSLGFYSQLISLYVRRVT